MLETRLLRRVIHYIWECYREQRVTHFSIQNYKGDELRVEERISDLTVIVRYLVKQPGGELIVTKGTACFILRHGEWIPLTLTQNGINAIYGTSDSETGIVKIFDTKGQATAAGICDAWALWLLEEGFLAAAALENPFGVKLPCSRWPKPTVPLPSLEQLEEWCWEDGGCEASDGCWVAYDGTCPHGHPSWLLRLDLM